MSDELKYDFENEYKSTRSLYENEEFAINKPAKEKRNKTTQWSDWSLSHSHIVQGERDVLICIWTRSRIIYL